MTELIKDFERLSPAKQKLLLRRLKAQSAQAERDAEVIPRSPRRDAPEATGLFPLSFAQQRLWFLSRLEPGLAHYNLPTALRLTGALRVAVLERALAEVTRRHESLRTVFETVNGEPFQRVLPASNQPDAGTLPRVDLAGLPAEVREAEALRLVAAEARRPFDIARGPHLRATLLRLAADGSEHALLFTMHHIVSDGWSMGVLVQEVQALYAAFASGTGSPLPELAIQYPDFADWQRGWLTGTVLAEQTQYWRERLTGAPAALDLPTDRPRPALPSYRGAHLGLLVPRDLLDRLAAGREREGDTLFMTLLAAFGALLARYSGQDDVPIGSPIANRNRFELEGLIGFFVNTLVLRVETEGDPIFQELLGRVRETTLGAYAHQDLPFEKLVEELRPERDLSRSPLFQVMFILQNTRSALSPQTAPQAAAEEAATLPALSLAPLEVPGISSKFDLTLSAAESPAGLAVAVEYSTDLFEEATVRRLLGHYSHLLAEIAADPRRRLSELPLLSAEERRQILLEWNVTGDAGDVATPDSRLHELFEAQARRTPERVALIAVGERLTYGDLDARAERLAGRLRGLGVGLEARVGLCADRTPALVTGLLAILKAGGAYVPLDPAYPEERLAFMLEDSGARVVVTQERSAARLPTADGVRRVLLDEPNAEDIEEAEAVADGTAAGTPGNLAYVIYTSGSTGRPKGVAIEHRSAVAMVRWALGVYSPEELRGVFAATSVCFDLSVFELFVPLAAGGAVILGENALALAGLPEAEAREVTLLNTVPSAAAELVRQRAMPPSVRTVNLAGEPLRKALADRLLELPGVSRVLNLYGPSEDTTYSTFAEVDAGSLLEPAIGRAIQGSQAYVLDTNLEPVPPGVPAELCLGGAGLARGYLGRPELTAERFVPNPFSARGGERLYRTGDLARHRADGDIEFLGRRDHQVKVRGFRIELGEIETALLRHPAIADIAVVVHNPAGAQGTGDALLAAYLAPAPDASVPEPAELRAFLQKTLPEPMIPSAWVPLPALPRNANGKLERRALPAPQARSGDAAAAPPTSSVERAVAAIWRDVLGVEEVGTRDNFFDLGGHSLLLAQVHERLRLDIEVGDLARDLPLIDLFRFPDIASLARHLSGRGEDKTVSLPLPGPSPVALPRAATRDVAIVGMAGRFPGAADLGQLWRNLREGVESISFFTPEELRAAGLGADSIGHPDHVPARGVLDGADLFDAGYFDYSPREAQLTDPQQRLFLECSAHALQDAGYDAAGRRIGVFAGIGISSYGIANLFSNPDVPAWAGGLPMMVGNDKDFVATRVAYKLDLRGPALTVQTACSTSLVAIHTACRSLLDGECEMALAGGVSVRFPQKQGYLYQEGGINSPDGHNRSFDAAAQGTVGGDGVGVVVLKPLAAALADGDTIHAVIRGSAINNDGSGKVGFTAPSVNGQAEVIAGALAAAGVSPETVQYVETHGSATPLGDPIEVAALNQAFGRGRGRETCAIGSIKSNVGHLDAAAGVAGLLKTVLALKHREIPPSLHFQRPNPQIDFAAGPFFVNTSLRPWEADGAARRAGVSSFGLGGTNVHIVLEEAPAPPPPAPARLWQLLALSARSEAALERATDDLAGWLGSQTDESLADAAFSLQVGRRPLDFRRAVVCHSVEDAREALASRDPRRVLSDVRPQGERPVAFLFPGLGDQYPGMARDLYRSEPAFSEAFDRCAEILLQPLGTDLRELLYPEGAEEETTPAASGGPDLRRMLRRGEQESTAGPLARTALAQPVVFAVEFALASLWMSWGVRPQAVIGYSLGEYVAACLSGVLSLEDALTLVAERALWIDELPAGAMLAVALSEEELAPLLGEDLSLAAINGPRLCVASGPPEAVAELERRLGDAGGAGDIGVATRRLETTHAFHSRMMEPLAGRLTERVSRFELHAPQIPYLSNVTGGWMTAELARDPGYWSRHLVEPVRFSEGIAELWREPSRVLLEVGPGRSLTSLALQHPSCTADPSVDRLAVTSLPSAYEKQPGRAALLHSLAKLWLAGVEVDWPGLSYGEMRRRIPLPAYPFDRQRYWIDPPRRQAALPAGPGRRAEIWQAGEPLAPLGPGELSDDLRKIGTRWLILATGQAGKPEGLGARVARRLAREGLDAVVVTPGDGFERTGEKSYAVSPGRRADWAALLDDAGGEPPRRVLHLWGLEGAAPATDDVLARFERAQVFACSLLPLLRELAERAGNDVVHFVVAADRLLPVTGAEVLPPEKAAAREVCEALAARHPHLRCRVLDLLPPENGQRTAWEESLVDRLLAELARDLPETAVAYRGDERWLPRELPAEPEATLSPETAPAAATPAAPAHARPNLRNAYVEPANDLERTLAAIWQGLLGVASVGRHDSFFEMGGHSLLATQLMADIRKRFGVSLPIASLFEAPTLSELAGVVEQGRGGPAAGGEAEPEALMPVVVIDPAHRYEPFPLTDIQQAYWLGRQATFELGGVGAHIYWEMDFTGFDLGRMTLAMRRCIARHEMLRAIVRPDGRQVILQDVPPFNIGTVDLRGLSSEEREEQLLGVRRQMSHQVLQPDRWPMFEMRAALIDGKRIRLYTSVDVLIGDGHSFGLLGGDIARFYADPEAEVPPLELSFRDYVLAEAALQETAAFERSLAYWRERVASLPPAPELPMVMAPAALEKPRFRRWTSRLEEPLWKPLKERGARAGLTPSGLLLAVFSEVLAAWSKTPRFTITLTLFNRMPVHPQVNEIVGDFTSLTLLGVDMSADGGFEARARAVQQRLWQDLDHRMVSGVRVLRELARHQGRQAAAAMPVVFTSTINPTGDGPGAAAQEDPPAAPAETMAGQDWNGPTAEMVYMISQTPQVWLDHQIGETAGTLTFNWDVVAELFPPGLIDDMFNTYREFLVRLATDESAWLQDRRRLIPASHLARRVSVNATGAALSEEYIHTLFEKRALEAPDRPAVIAPERTLTYGELRTHANRLGRILRERGARPNTLVAVVQEKGWEMVVSVLGVQVAGAAYLPIEPGLPRERIQLLLERGEVEFVLTQSWIDERLEWPDDVQRILVDRGVGGVGGMGEAGEWAGVDDSFLKPVQSLSDLSYVIFTSGSTGLPKGVMIDHRGAVNTIVDLNERFAVGPDDRVLAVSSLSFDLSVYDIFGLLAAGGAVVMPRAERAWDPAHWAERVVAEKVTIWDTVPALMKLLVEHIEAATGHTGVGGGNGNGARLAGTEVPLRLVMMSGDWIPLDLPDRIRAIAGPGIRVMSLGGATEASIWSILYPIGAIEPEWKSVPYGKPMVNQTFHVLDDRLEPRPDWVPGNLYIGGVGLAKGYWRDPEKTAASFIVHPDTQERLYRTGDLGRYYPDGNIEFLGREDFQVKIQGYRIELGEIEAALGEHPAVREAVVAAVGERMGNKRLVAYVVPSTETGDRELTGDLREELRGHLRGKLPEYMVPSIFITLTALPLGPTGKVDRKALPAPDLAFLDAGKDFVEPRTETERTLAGIWAELLKAQRVGAHDNFYELGGDSLLATQVMSRVRESFRVELPLQTFFEAPTLETLAEAVDRAAVAETAETDALAALVQQLQDASPEEVDRLLAELRQQEEGGLGG